MRKIILIIFLFSLYACSTEVTRIDLLKNENIAININCEKDRQIDFYLDCDVEYKELPVMVMDFEFFRGTEQILKGGLDPLAAFNKTNEVKVSADGKKKWKFYGKLEGNFIPTADTVFTIKPTLIYNKTPLLKFNKFELVFVR